MKKSDPVVYNQPIAHYRNTCRQRTRRKNEGLSDNLEIYDLIEPAVVTFSSVKDCARTISFNDDNVQVMTSINLVDRVKVLKLQDTLDG
ncbi:unnamed protein product [Orchesella dallaii]|uniref:Uncharacterized protein n=1 Tax=Orchesella dallaii TaxID=48710 RepID=A0ABP1RLW5_9HEXA